MKRCSLALLCALSACQVEASGPPVGQASQDLSSNYCGVPLPATPAFAGYAPQATATQTYVMYPDPTTTGYWIAILVDYQSGKTLWGARGKDLGWMASVISGAGQLDIVRHPPPPPPVGTDATFAIELAQRSTQALSDAYNATATCGN